MKTKYKYIKFGLVEQLPKTSVWQCINTKGGYPLGYVKWYPLWRQYCYFPTETAAVYSAGCLEDINDFITQLEQDRKEKICLK